NKSSGPATLAGNLTINGDFTVSRGTLDLGNLTAGRSTVGGTLTLAAGTMLKIGSAFPASFGVRSIAPSSTVEYNAVGGQTVAGETYGQLIFSNGGSNAKTLAAATTVSGDLLIRSNATFAANSYLITLQG